MRCLYSFGCPSGCCLSQAAHQASPPFCLNPLRPVRSYIQRDHAEEPPDLECASGWRCPHRAHVLHCNLRGRMYLARLKRLTRGSAALVALVTSGTSAMAGQAEPPVSGRGAGAAVSHVGAPPAAELAAVSLRGRPARGVPQRRLPLPDGAGLRAAAAGRPAGRLRPGRPVSARLLLV